ncbi:DNA polymerase-4 [Scopulibacillus daqui]|uniref:DNA polymerase IV n=1 Tax=Scopulibacillus daqui TaxID=1469162 RepID=A0ABS2Q2T2_9BACL|nr:DNA polymerase IV [Scopulibacillus daqui]MBM7646155.1 DNA polymerase-4 [Scopulibacillus daqui]
MAEKAILLVDMESFYASVEKADHPELKNHPVIVSGDPERRSGVVLAACPLAKKRGVKNAYRLWEAQQLCPEAVVVRPRMQRYLDVAMEITDILEEFTDMVEPYSIDEQFMDVTGSQRLFGMPSEIAQKVKAAIKDRTGVNARCGIGPNKVLAKIACDHFSKKNDTGIFQLNQNNIKQCMWPLPVGAMFGVGSRMERHLRRLGISTIGRLANYPLDILKKKWGINGQVLWETANGIDHSPVSVSSHEGQKAIGHAMTLPRDYQNFEKEIKVILLELSEEVCSRARTSGVMGYTVSTGCQGANNDSPAGFYRQTTLVNPTNHTMDVFHEAKKLFLKFWDGQPVRRITVNLSHLCSDKVRQISFFDDYELRREIGYTMDRIKQRYGPDAIIRAISLTEAGQAADRAKKIGGHYK